MGTLLGLAALAFGAGCAFGGCRSLLGSGGGCVCSRCPGDHVFGLLRVSRLRVSLMSSLSYFDTSISLILVGSAIAAEIVLNKL